MKRPTLTTLGALASLCLWASGACVPPQGVGPTPLPRGLDSGMVRVGLQYAGHPDRHAIDLEVSATGRLDEYFSLETGIMYSALRDPGLYPDQRDDSSFEHSGFPFVRPALHFGPVTLSLPVSGFFLLGPGGGGAYGWGAFTAAYTEPDWAIFAGLAGHGFKYLTDSSEPTGTAWQVALGGQYFWVSEIGAFAGFDLELVYGEQTYTEHGPQTERTRRYVVLVVGLDLGWASTGE